MIGLYDAIAGRLQVAGRCPDVVQVVTGMSAEAVDGLTLADTATAVVMPLADQAAPVREAGLQVTQYEAIRFGVLLALTYPAGFAQFEPARDQIKAALRGWTPGGCDAPVQYSGGRLLAYDASDGGKWLHLLEFVCGSLATYGVQT